MVAKRRDRHAEDYLSVVVQVHQSSKWLEYVQTYVWVYESVVRREGLRTGAAAQRDSFKEWKHIYVV